MCTILSNFCHRQTHLVTCIRHSLFIMKVKGERSTHLPYTVFHGGLEHLNIETRLIDERFASVMGECVIVTVKVNRLYST